MSWIFDHLSLGHRVFISFIELKIEGNWAKYEIPSGGKTSRLYDVLSAHDPENCNVHIIEPDGLRRILHFTQGGTISINQNIFSYHPDQVDEIAVDEKEQSGKGITRHKL